MNEENPQKTDPGTALKHELRARKEELQRPDATQKSQYVSFVERNWYKSLVSWMNTKHGENPGPIPNNLLCKDGKLDPTKHYGKDFAVVSVALFDRLVDYFKGGPKIVRPYAIIPGSDKAQFIMEPITLTIMVDNKILKKVVDPKWKIGPIRAQLCNSLKLGIGKSRFLTKDKATVDDNLEIDQVISSENMILTLDVDPEARGSEYTRFKTFEKAPLRILQTPDKNTSFLVCVECLLSIPPLIDFVLAEGFEHQINRDNKRGSGGAIARGFLKLARERAADELEAERQKKNGSHEFTGFDEQVDASELKSALVEKYPDLLDFGRFDAEGTLAALLDGLFEDTNRGQSVTDGSPIADIFIGTLRGNLECPNCHSFEEIKERFLFLSLSIPSIGSEVQLQDCIAHFSISEEIPEQQRVKCKSCKKLVRAYRTVAVDFCPEVLIIPFKRFGGMGALTSFVQSSITYPDELDVASFSSSSTGIYKLVAVIFHQGMIDNKKYSCACLDPKTGQWIYISKDKSLIVDSSGAHSGDALVLFYQKSSR